MKDGVPPQPSSHSTAPVAIEPEAQVEQLETKSEAANESSVVQSRSPVENGEEHPEGQLGRGEVSVDEMAGRDVVNQADPQNSALSVADTQEPAEQFYAREAVGQKTHNGPEQHTPDEEPTLLTTGAPAQQDKVTRLSRLIQNLKQKVERLQNENLQLEEMLAAADAAHRGGSSEISRLESALKSEQTARRTLESRLHASMETKDGEIASLKAQVEASSKQIAFLSESLATNEAAVANADAQRSANESQLISTLRKEMETTESLLEEERRAHTATRRASAQRERELDTALTEAAQSLATMQQTLEQRTERAMAAEERCSTLEVEVATYEKKAAQAEEALRLLREQLESSQSGQEANQRVEELEQALDDARNRASEAESICSTARETATRLQTEVDVLRRQLLEARATDAADLRRRLQEVTEALYSKQNQLELALADKAAAQLLLERREKGPGSHNVLGAAEAGQMTKRRPLQRMLFGGQEGDDVDMQDMDSGIVPTETVSLALSRLANAPGRLGKAVQTGAHFLDSTAYQAAKLLRRSPMGRLAMFCYIIGMHLFIYLLLHRLQHRAFTGMMSSAQGSDSLQDDFSG